MNEFPNSIRNNMVNTEYKINITSLPETNLHYEVQREDSNKVRNIVLAAVLAAGLLAGMGAITAAQTQSMQQNTAVVATEVLPGGATLNVTENTAYSYIVTPDGEKVSTYNGINAQELAKSYQDAPAMGRQM